MTRTTDAKNRSDVAQIKDRVQLAYHAALTRDLTGTSGHLTKATLEEELEKEFGNSTSIVLDGDYWSITVNGNEIEKIKATETTTVVINAETVQAEPNTYYGKEVTNYITGNGVNKWRVFHSDGTNIYLIADDYILQSEVPSKDGVSISDAHNPGGYTVARTSDLLNKYMGAPGIMANTSEIGLKWLSRYLNYTTDNGTTYPLREQTCDNIKVTEFLLDTSIWNIYKNDTAEYAIGGTPIELYVESYNNKHPKSNAEQLGYTIEYANTINGQCGYTCSNQTDLSDLSDNGIYIIEDTSKANGVFLASPASSSSDFMKNFTLEARSGGSIVAGFGSDNCGLRPVVCLNSNINLKEVGNNLEIIL